MFTGIIQKIGKIQAVKGGDGGRRLTIAHDPWETPLVLGESVAVQGVCLTVAEVSGGGFTCDLLGETLARTCLGRVESGRPVNLERALKAGDSLGGHFVTGHVDGVATVRSLRSSGADHILELACGADLTDAMVEKGSVACDGVSLTLSDLSQDSFEVCLIPFTWTHTALGGLRQGAPVNIETDVLGKYVLRALGDRLSGGTVTLEKLRQAGFID